MNVLIGLIPALLWGIMPIAVGKIGGKPINQLLGTVYGALILGIISLFINKPIITKQIFFWNFVVGLFWAFGQITQYSAYTEIGVSRTMPATTGLQLVLVSLIGVLFFGSWSTNFLKLLGALAIILDVIGVVMTTVRDSRSASRLDKKTFRLGMTNTLIGTLGFVAYNSLPKIPNASGWQMFFPQTLGMLTFSIIISLVMNKYRHQKPLFSKLTLQNILTGFIFGGACCGFLFSIKLNGLSTGFTLSQLAVAIATVSGIFILHEHKTKREFTFSILGLMLILIGTCIAGVIQ